MTTDVVAQIAAAVAGRPAVDGIRLVGVDGPSGSGKDPALDADPELRLAPGMARDTAFPGKRELWQRWMLEEDAFVAEDGTRERADLVIDTSAHPVEQAVPIEPVPLEPAPLEPAPLEGEPQ